MNRTRALLAVCFCAGMIGALANSLAIWLLYQWGIYQLAGVAMEPGFTMAWLYTRLIWGGLWGIPFFLTVGPPRNRRHWIRKALWMSLLPTAAQLFYIFPNQTPYGMFGAGLGTLTPLFVVLVNLVWGFFTGLFTRLLWGRT